MNYENIYTAFILSRRAMECALLSSGAYKERHHILPLSLGGGDSPQNLIFLSARDHYFAHCCLAKVHGGKMWSALFAVAAMTKVDKSAAYFLRAAMVRVARERAATVRSRQMTSLWAAGEFKRVRVYGPMAEEVKEKIRKANLGKKRSEDSVARMSARRQQEAKKFEFFHAETGEQFSGSQSAFVAHTSMDQSLASALTRGRIKMAKQWVLKGTDVRAIRGRDSTIRVFENVDGTIFSGTMYEFRTTYQLDAGVISNLVKGKNHVKSFKGWTYAGTKEECGPG